MTNKYLISWYGITDLRAAMGFENQGPVLGALLTGEYTHSYILAYTKATSPEPELLQKQDNAIAWLEENKNNLQNVERNISWDYVDILANTEKGHQFYFKWLKNQLKSRTKSVGIQTHQVMLKHLNDTRGIYLAASEALENIQKNKSPNECQITLFLSPGTPVMAFSWAFVAMANPEKNIKVIASPDIKKGIEQIEMPYEIVNSGLKLPNKEHPENFDMVFHLLGQQTLPSVLGVMQFPSKIHVFVTSEDYSANIVRNIVPRNESVKEIKVKPFDSLSTKDTILSIIRQYPGHKRVGFNLTGGTKLMYAGALSACHQVNGSPFYFEPGEHKMIWLNDFSTQEIKGFSKVDSFFTASGCRISRSGHWTDNPSMERRIPLTKALWQNRREICILYKDLEKYNNKWAKPFQFSEGGVDVSLSRLGNALCRIGGEEFTYSNCPDFAKYLSGGWLEEYTYLILKPLKEEGLITDLRIGVQLDWDDNSRITVQELDIVFSNGKQLYIIECKAGGAKSEDVMKLQNNVSNFGGVAGRGALVAAFEPQHPNVRKRIEAVKNLGLFIGNSVPELLASKILNFSGKGVYPPYKT